LESQPGRDFLCVETDPKYGFKGRVPPTEFKRGFARVVTDIAEGEVTSRDLNDNPSIKTYLEKIKDYKPDQRKRGSFKSTDIIKKPETSAGVIPTKQKRTKGHRPTRGLIPSDLKCGVNNQRIHDVFNELRKLKVVAEFPNACAIMLRVLLELSVSHYIQSTGKTKDLLNCHPKEKQKRGDWHPSLRQQLDFMLKHMNLPLEPLERKGINQFVSSTHSTYTLDSLDLFIHNKNVQPPEPEVRAIWGKVEPLLRIVLTEPTLTKS
jgi:hypothetical protein